MKMVLNRKWYTDTTTIGELYINGIYQCYILEDAWRLFKLPGKTAIPAGLYKVELVYSPKFSPRYGRQVPKLLNVPNYTEILMHAGNTEEDTEGCLLTGKVKELNKVAASRAALFPVLDLIDTADKNNEEVWIEIKDDSHHILGGAACN